MKCFVKNVRTFFIVYLPKRRDIGEKACMQIKISQDEKGNRDCENVIEYIFELELSKGGNLCSDSVREAGH